MHAAAGLRSPPLLTVPVRTSPAGSATSPIRWGLCCTFTDSTPRFRHATHRYVASLGADAGRRYLSDIALANAVALAHAVERCTELGIGAFRINSQILPLGTHPVSGYEIETLERAPRTLEAYRAAGRLAAERDVRLSFHPDQFIVLSSQRDDVVRVSIRELDFQGRIAELVGADVITLHGGSAAGGKGDALGRLERAVAQLSPAARSRLALENDDRTYTVADLLPTCERLGLPLVYDAHHHRCNPDGLSVDEATELAAATWGAREPYFHISSPRDGWGSPNQRPHADYVEPSDVPALWREMRITVDAEAKAKERAVVAIREIIGSEHRAPGRA